MPISANDAMCQVAHCYFYVRFCFRDKCLTWNWRHSIFQTFLLDGIVLIVVHVVIGIKRINMGYSLYHFPAVIELFHSLIPFILSFDLLPIEVRIKPL